MSLSKRCGRPPQHRAFQPGKRHMDLLPSISRSSGLDKDGDALTDFTVQEEYREYIQGKLEEYWRRRGAPDAEKGRQDVEQNLLILFRKLREGVLSSNRSDEFALKVYETSVHLSILFHSPGQTTSTLSHLLPELYLRVFPSPPPFADSGHPAFPTTILALLHNLISGYPSQSRYHELLHSLPRTFLPRDSDAYRWMDDLTRTLRRRNYARLERLTQRDAFASFAAPDKVTSSGHAGKDGSTADADNRAKSLHLEALCTLVDAVRAKARETAWRILRGAYRELTCPLPGRTAEVPLTTSEWLARSLTLRSVLPQRIDHSISIAQLVDDWLNGKCKEGEVRRKEGIEGRWIVCKVPVKA
ncbi:hypothetical protein BKA93DRAFT_725687 [Sparassis latifolia]|uniref:Uncharacterized protein n=1 Tax=Sparassis crispa TaxID=139825 RepID=A0A401GLJ7_9APHY|nr:hypothetical protein SCP_0501090 [Sparassis crispa]GBE83063.1 hypothetical protein SCP_0501090 [Sparassis crispa]